MVRVCLYRMVGRHSAYLEINCVEVSWVKVDVAGSSRRRELALVLPFGVVVHALTIFVYLTLNKGNDQETKRKSVSRDKVSNDNTSARGWFRTYEEDAPCQKYLSAPPVRVLAQTRESTVAETCSTRSPP